MAVGEPKMQAGERELTTNGFVFDTRPEAFGELRDANGLLGDPQALQKRIADDGYLLLRGFLDRDLVLSARRELAEKLDGAGLIDRSRPVIDAVYSGTNARLAEIDRKAFATDLRTGPALREVVQRGRMIDFFGTFLGGPVLSLDYVWVRNVRVGSATGCHIDWVYMGRGTRNLYTAWTPIGDVPITDGPLAILAGSHKLEQLQQTYGALDVDRDKNHPYVGGWLSKDAPSVRDTYGGRWLTTEFAAGDVLIFGMFLVHCSLDNKSPEGRIRLSTDTRYQLRSEPADERWVGEQPFGHGMD